MGASGSGTVSGSRLVRSTFRCALAARRISQKYVTSSPVPSTSKMLMTIMKRKNLPICPHGRDDTLQIGPTLFTGSSATGHFPEPQADNLAGLKGQHHGGTPGIEQRHAVFANLQEAETFKVHDPGIRRIPLDPFGILRIGKANPSIAGRKNWLRSLIAFVSLKEQRQWNRLVFHNTSWSLSSEDGPVSSIAMSRCGLAPAIASLSAGQRGRDGAVSPSW